MEIDAGMVEHLDFYGRFIIDHLKQIGESETTLVVFRGNRAEGSDLFETIVGAPCSRQGDRRSRNTSQAAQARQATGAKTR